MLASGDNGVSFDSHGDTFAFLQLPWFLVAVGVVLLASAVAARALGTLAESGTYAAALSGVSIGAGALLFAGTLCGDGYAIWPGLLGGLACAGLANAAVRGVLAGAATRLDHDAASALWIYAELAALLLAGLCIVIPPISIVALAALGWLWWQGRSRGGEKYAGLRILR